ncbi:MAG: Panacea domain-containing protein, partial [Thermoanaerobaculia bacterium]
ILHLAKLSDADPRCGRTKLNKLLFYIDFRAYERLGAPVSGQVYRKREFGPTPEAFMPAVRALERDGTCAWVEGCWHDRPLKRLVALREPDLSLFQEEELELVRAVVNEFLDCDAREISARSHRFAGWQAAHPGEEIPYQMVFVDDARPLSPEEEDWASTLLGEYLGKKTVAG